MSVPEQRVLEDVQSARLRRPSKLGNPNLSIGLLSSLIRSTSFDCYNIETIDVNG